MNSLQDVEIIDALYRAADAGVDIELNVRGICCLKTGPRPNGKVIRVVSIVDRYLEHARIFFFPPRRQPPAFHRQRGLDDPESG